MNLNRTVILERYVSPAVRQMEVCLQRSLLIVSGDQNEEVGGKDDPDIEW